MMCGVIKTDFQGVAVCFGSGDYHLSSSGIVNHEFFIAVLFLYVEMQLSGINDTHMNAV